MAFLKSFLFAHGEKLLLGLVAIFALWSIVGNIIGGYSDDIKPSEINQNLDKIKQHLSSKKVQREKPEILRSTRIVEDILSAYAEKVKKMDGWESFYILPPKPEKQITLVRDDTLGKKYFPPEDYVPSIGAATDLRVEVGGKRVILAFRESEKCRWIQGVRAKIYRKAVGYGVPDADYKAVHSRQLERLGAAAIKMGNTETAGIDENPDAGIFGGRFVNRNPGSAVPSETEAAGDARNEAEYEKKLLEEKEMLADQDLNELLKSGTEFNSKWELIADDVNPVAGQPDVQNVIEGLLRGEERELTPADRLPEENYQRKWFFYVDDYKEGGLVENMVYRYRVVLYAKAADVPEEIKVKNTLKLKKYIPFVKMGRQRLAMNGTEFKNFVEKNDVEQKMAKAEYLEFTPLQEITGFNLDDSEKTMLWVDKNTSVSEGATYYAQMSYSNYFLTPVRTTFSFLSKFGNDTAMITVTVVDDDGKKVSTNFTVKMPTLPPESAKLLPNPYQKYPLDKITPTPIGSEKKVNGIIYDFSTGWGLVDIKDCEVLVKPYKLVPKKDETGRTVVVNGEEVKVKEYTSEIKLNSSYLVVVELESKIKGKRRRFDRIPKYRKSFMPEDLQYIWNPK